MRLIEQLFKVLAPYNCLRCNKEGSLLCYWCTEEALIEPDSRCYKCNKLTQYMKVCAQCRRKSPLKQVLVRAEYTDSAKELVHKMKFSYSGEAADIIADELLHTLPSLSSETIIMHVPTITTHVRQRGFDHAARIAQRISKKSGVRHVPALARLGQHRQVGSKRSARHLGVKGTFYVRYPNLVRDADVLLIDDVVTTGSTLEAAAYELKRAGAKSVSALTFARAK